MPPIGGDPRGYRWLTISDFRPGIFSNDNWALRPNSGGVFIVPPGPISAPLGAAQESGTTDCIAVPSGALAPGPSVKFSLKAPSAYAGANTCTNGFFSAGPILANNVLPHLYNSPTSDILLIGSEKISAGRFFQLDLVAYDPYSNTTWATSTPATVGSVTDLAWEAPAFSTMTGGTSVFQGTQKGAYAIPYYPFFATTYYALAPVNGGLSSQMGYDGQAFLWMVPDVHLDLPPGSVAPYQFQGNQYTYPSYVFTHQGRVVWFQMNAQTMDPGVGGIASGNQWQNGMKVSNAPINAMGFTDPPGTLTTSGGVQMLFPENPFGIGAWGSISASELIVINQQQGAYSISGPLNNASVTYLGGVTPTGGIVSSAGQTPMGLVYGAQNRGAWLWTGGDSSSKLSPQIRDDAFSIPAHAQQIIFGPSQQFMAWGDWILGSNNWLFDTNTGGWWRLSQPTIGGVLQDSYFLYGTSYRGDYAYAVPFQPSSTATVAVLCRSTPSHSFSWTSAPIPLSQNPSRKALVREITVVAIGNGTIALTLIDDTGGTHPSQPSTVNYPGYGGQQVLRFDFGVECTNLVIQLVSTGSSSGAVYPAPVVIAINIGVLDETTKLASAT